jgi:hypothetical protein
MAAPRHALAAAACVGGSLCGLQAVAASGEDEDRLLQGCEPAARLSDHRLRRTRVSVPSPEDDEAEGRKARLHAQRSSRCQYAGRAVRRWELQHRGDKFLTELAAMHNPCVRGWIATTATSTKRGCVPPLGSMPMSFAGHATRSGGCAIDSKEAEAAWTPARAVGISPPCMQKAPARDGMPVSARFLAADFAVMAVFIVPRASISCQFLSRSVHRLTLVFEQKHRYPQAFGARSSAVEHLTFNQRVVGSIPTGLTNKIKKLDRSIKAGSGVKGNAKVTSCGI